MSKTNKLSIQKQIEIAKYKKKYPKLSMTVIAEQFNVTYDQVNYALKKANAGQLQLGKIKPKKIDYDAEISVVNNLLESNYLKALVQLEHADDIAVDDRINLIAKISSAKKTIQDIAIQSHMKGLDGVTLASFARRFKPDLSDDDIIKIWYEELEKNRK